MKEIIEALKKANEAGKKKPATFSLSEKTISQIKEIADQTGATISEVAEALLRAVLDERP